MMTVLLVVVWLLCVYLLIGCVLGMYWLRKTLRTPGEFVAISPTFLGVLAAVALPVLEWPWLLGRTQ